LFLQIQRGISMSSSESFDEEDPLDDPVVSVPEDFPRDPFPEALTGMQHKVAAREIDGRYVVGLTDDERRGRYLMCADLVEQLTGYTERKRIERVDLTLPQLLTEIDAGIRRKGWEVGPAEFDWIMVQLRSRFL